MGITKRLILENFRCFGGRQEVTLRPLTLLVGENSTGKTSFLAAVRLAWELAYGRLNPDFNEEPFELGVFDQIARFRGGRGGKAHEFTLGFLIDPIGSAGDALEVTARFHKAGTQPSINRLEVTCGAESLIAVFAEDRTVRSLKAITDTQVFDQSYDPKESLLPSVGLSTLLEILLIHVYMEDEPDTSTCLRKAGKLRHSLHSCEQAFSRKPLALAPIRSKPKRTYDPARDTPEPSGGHVPMVLARIVSGRKEDWKELKGNLESFGRNSGLFDAIEVRRLGKTEAVPFQLRFRISGPPTNMVDVGYGVSQAVPILVDALLTDRGSTFLMQQPEVHLHPRAQAELGTFMGTLAKHQDKHFIVETHSDYIIDRIRMDVRDRKTVAPEDVAILYFQREGADVRIFEISLDDQGNIHGAPEGYRRFFLDEERRFFSRA